MNFRITVDAQSSTPIYKQIISQIESATRSGVLKEGEILPSMNKLAERTGVSKETVKKAYAILRDNGVIEPKQGKGFYVCGKDFNRKLSVLMLFDKISMYKQETFNAFTRTIGDTLNTTILTFHQNIELFEYYLYSSLDKYDYYIVTPHFAQDEKTQKRALKLITRIPNRKLIMLDNWMKEMPGNYGVVAQDFDNDIYNCLTQNKAKFAHTGRICVIKLPSSLYGDRISQGIARFGEENGIKVNYFTDAPDDIRKGDVFILLNGQLENGIYELSLKIKENNLKIGKEVGIISYNEFSLNQLILGGLTPISSDFAEMGKNAAKMILDGKMSKVHNEFKMISRATF